eukprot:536979-Pyramimonas_sp.AAC.1
MIRWLDEVLTVNWGVECTLAVIGTGGPVRRSNIMKVLTVNYIVSVSSPAFTAAANPIVRIYPRFLRLIGSL